MSWADYFSAFCRKEADVSDGGGDAGAALSTPIRGFTVLRIAYPNHLHPEVKPLTNYDIALRLSYDMDREWFGKDRELEHFATTMPVRGNSENEDAFGFDFGPCDPDTDTDDFTHQYTVIVRETAGGGFMLLIQDSALAFADKIRELFDAVVADRERENPDLSDGSDETTP